MDRAARSDLALTPWYGPTLEQFVVYAERAFGGLGLRSASPGNGERKDTSLHGREGRRLAACAMLPIVDPAVGQHAALSLERWREFSASQQVLMIANEMHRASLLLGPGAGDSRRNAYERVLRLTDLTIEAPIRPGLRRELLLWRGLVAELFVDDEPRPASHLAALHALLLLDREAARQRPYVLPRAAAAAFSSD